MLCVAPTSLVVVWPLHHHVSPCPAADSNVLKVPEGVDDLDAVLLTDILPTGWHATEMGEVGPGDVVAIWGAGPGGWLRPGIMNSGTATVRCIGTTHHLRHTTVTESVIVTTEVQL